MANLHGSDSDDEFVGFENSEFEDAVNGGKYVPDSCDESSLEFSNVDIDNSDQQSLHNSSIGESEHMSDISDIITEDECSSGDDLSGSGVEIHSQGNEMSTEEAVGVHEIENRNSNDNHNESENSAGGGQGTSFDANIQVDLVDTLFGPEDEDQNEADLPNDTDVADFQNGNHYRTYDGIDRDSLHTNEVEAKPQFNFLEKAIPWKQSRFDPIFIEPFTQRVGPKLPENFDTATATPIDYFRLFMTDDVYQTICDNTNNYVQHYAEVRRITYPDYVDKFWYDVTVPELKAFFGINIIFGYSKTNRYKMNWSSDPFLQNAGIKNTLVMKRWVNAAFTGN